MKDFIYFQSIIILPEQLDVLQLANYCFNEDEDMFFASPPHGNPPKPYLNQKGD